MIAVTTVQFTLGLFVALLLNLGLRGTRFFRTLFFLPVILGVTIQGLMWTLFLYPLGGPLQSFLNLFGVQSLFLGGQPTEAFFWVIVVQIWANLGFTMVIFLAGLQTIPEEVYESARIDGASRWQAFKNVTWPLLTPAVNTNLVLTIIGSLQAWQLFLVLTGYRPGTQVMGYLVYAEAFGADVGEHDDHRLPAGIRRGGGDDPLRHRAGDRHHDAIPAATERGQADRMSATMNPRCAPSSGPAAPAVARKPIDRGRLLSYAILYRARSRTSRRC